MDTEIKNEILVISWFHEENTSDGVLWQRYRDIEIDIIEEAYQQQKTDVTLGEYRIDLLRFCEINLDNEVQERRIKRSSMPRRKNSLRADRFFTPYLPHEFTSCQSHDAWCPFLTAWFQTNSGKKAIIDLPECVEQCVQGILKEAALHGSRSIIEAQYLASKIRQHNSASRRKLSEICIYFYTKDSFLYNTLNSAVRTEDHSKLETMGPMCYLIHNYGRFVQDYFGTVYRGMQLSETEIEEYEISIGKWKTWTAFASTSKDRSVAEAFGNVLFIIEVKNIMLSTRRSFDISSLSQYPDEEEVLFPAGTSFQVLRVERNLSLKTIVHALS